MLLEVTKECIKLYPSDNGNHVVKTNSVHNFNWMGKENI